MKILLDTHILLWWLNDDAKLSENARQIILDPNNTFYVSQASLWEIQIKNMSGKLKVDLEVLIQQLSENNFQQLILHTNHILALAKLPPYHQDPFDRMIISQAMSEPLHLITHDKNVSSYDASIILV
ncbi:MAG: type II toxin-antitoxin system VapC family toxin [Methylococcaceae bacterium]|nr:type II toxin-antitoxin system VapC family toxin [Methylococcaceae bacterium]